MNAVERILLACAIAWALLAAWLWFAVAGS
jgi:hypothetical protein